MATAVLHNIAVLLDEDEPIDEDLNIPFIPEVPNRVPDANEYDRNLGVRDEILRLFN